MNTTERIARFIASHEWLWIAVIWCIWLILTDDERDAIREEFKHLPIP